LTEATLETLRGYFRPPGSVAGQVAHAFSAANGCLRQCALVTSPTVAPAPKRSVSGRLVRVARRCARCDGLRGDAEDPRVDEVVAEDVRRVEALGEGDEVGVARVEGLEGGSVEGGELAPVRANGEGGEGFFDLG
jgi:hypothetical protein